MPQGAREIDAQSSTRARKINLMKVKGRGAVHVCEVMARVDPARLSSAWSLILRGDVLYASDAGCDGFFVGDAKCEMTSMQLV